MAVQKKKKTKSKNDKTPSDLKVFNWTPKRKLVALLLSTGLKTNEEVAEAARIHFTTLYEWKKYPVFLKEVERLTFLQENATRAGIVRKVLKAIDQKEKYLSEDRSTLLDYLEFLVKVIPPDVKAEDDPLKELADAILSSAKLIGK